MDKRHIKSYTGLRGIAVILVTFYHLRPDICVGGYLGVVIFLVMSGYLVTLNILKEMDCMGRADIGKFYKKRFTRVYLPLLPFISIVGLIAIFSSGPMIKDFASKSITSILGVNNIYQISKWLSYFDMHMRVDPFTHLWTLSIEMQMYLLFPLFMDALYGKANLNKKTMSAIVMILVILSSYRMYALYDSGADVSRVYYGTDTRALSFLIGSFFAFLFEGQTIENYEPYGLKKAILSAISIAAISYFIYDSFNLDPQDRFLYNGGMVIHSMLIAVVMLIIASDRGILARIISTKPLVILGKRSYSIYLWQYAVMVFLDYIFSHTLVDHNLLTILSCLVTLIFGELSYRAFEKLRVNEYIDGKKNKKLKILFVIICFLLIFSASAYSFSYQDDMVNLKAKLDSIADEEKKEIEKTKQTDVAIDQGQIPSEVAEIDGAKTDLKSEEGGKNTAKDNASADYMSVGEQSNLEQKVVAEGQSIPDGQMTDPAISKSASDATAGTEQNPSYEQDTISTGVVFIGDSIMLGAKPEIEKVFTNCVVDAKVSRQAWSLQQVIYDMDAQKKFRQKEIVVIHLGSNGKFDKKTFENAIKSLGDRQIYLINSVVPRTWEQEVNQTLSEIESDFDNVRVIDWYANAKTKGELFYQDSTHPNDQGVKAYVELIKNSI